jgi:hypothetical protein
MAQADNQAPGAKQKRTDPNRADAAGDGPVQARKSEDRKTKDKQIAQDRQQSTGVSTGQS